MINNGFIHLIGSDAHNNKKRNFCLREALTITEKLIGEKNISIIKENSEKILIGKECLSYTIINSPNKSIFNKIISFIRNS